MLESIKNSGLQDAATPRRRLSHVEALRRGLSVDPPARKRDRTRARLLVATAEVLAEKGFERLRIADVAAAADISPAAFYAYFTDRGDAAQRVLTRFVDRLYALEGADQRALGGPEALRRLITAQLAVAHADGGLLRALGQAVDVTPTLADQVRR
ncbi:MAG TPA: TetR family transcriptional regulator, partial [Phenylobacterium sp.]|nr:TetR family transcriptional regulator [Phenylobacterium sp.]